MLTSRNPYDKIGQLDNHIYNNRSSDEKVQAQYFSKRSLSPSIESVEGGTPPSTSSGGLNGYIFYFQRKHWYVLFV